VTGSLIGILQQQIKCLDYITKQLLFSINILQLIIIVSVYSSIDMFQLSAKSDISNSSNSLVLGSASKESTHSKDQGAYIIIKYH